MMRTGYAAAAAFALAVFAAPASAVTYEPIDTTEGHGDFEAELTIAGNVVTVTIENTTVGDTCILTGFLLGGDEETFPELSVTGFSTTDADFALIQDQTAQPFDNTHDLVFEFGAALGGDWTGGGNPNGGLAVGSSATFTFTLASLAGLTAEDFTHIAVRFKACENDESDKVLGVVDGNGNGNGGPPPIPEPGTMGLLGTSLAGLLWRRRKQQLELQQEEQAQA